MKEKLKNKKVVYTIIGIVSILLVALAVTYAYWLVTKTQTGENEISSACLDIAISGEKNDITLSNQFPMSEEDGMKLVPYEFTVTNNCNTSVDYQVALEATGNSSNALSGTSLKVALNDSAKLYSAYPNVGTTIEGAYESRVLGYSRLAASGIEGSSATYSLRIWIDEDAPISEMNKTFTSKISVTIGQGIESPYEEGTLAYDILANYNGVNAISEIDVNQYDHRIIASGDRYIPSSFNYYYYGTEYTYDETTRKYTLSGTIVYESPARCDSGYTTKTVCLDVDCIDFVEEKIPLECRYTFFSTKSNYNNSTIYEVTDFQGGKTNYITANTIQYTTAFDSVSTANESGLYKKQDDLGDSYYYRGNPTNNYVEFGSYTQDYTRARGYWSSTSTSYKEYATLEECNAATSYNYNCTEYVYASAGDPMYWRIVRINGDGSVRLVYDGVEKTENGVAHTATVGETKYNTNSDNVKYVGYTYDVDRVQTDSTIKGVVDAWYDKHLKTNYGTYIADSIFCNDRSEASYRYYDENYDSTTDPNAAVYTDINYGAVQRLMGDKVPSLRCANQSDRYTVDDTTNGNGLLSNPVGLITADEVFLAGGSLGTNDTYYLYTGGDYWTSTPIGFDTVDAIVWHLYDDGHVDDMRPVAYISGARPVISLKADVEFTGDGTIDNPYKIVTE